MNDLLPEDDFFIADAAPDAAKATKMKKSTFARIVAAAACLVLIFGTGAWTYAAAVEYRDYRTAVEFFNENGLSSEGLTRSEIKAVWRDITTNSFKLFQDRRGNKKHHPRAKTYHRRYDVR